MSNSINHVITIVIEKNINYAAIVGKSKIMLELTENIPSISIQSFKISI